MAEYGVKYRFRWNDEGGGDWRIDICQAGYTGDILPRAIGASSVSLRRDRNGNICGTSLELTAECRVDEEFAELYTTDPFEFKVLVYAESVCIWTGYVTPELYSEPFIAPPYDVKVTASDNLGELKLTEWVGVGRLTFAQLLNTLLAQTGLSMGVKYISTLATGSISAQAFFSTVTIDLDELSGKSYYDVLDQLLASFHAVIFQHGGSWVVLRETDVVPSISGGAVVPAGQSAGMPIRSLGSAYAGGLWPENHVDLTVEPAKKAISLVCPELWNRCGTASITNPSTGNATGTLTATFAAADGINLNDSSTMSRYPLALNIEALRKNRSNKVYYDIVVKVRGNGVTRYLVENTDAAEGYAWQSSSASIRITPGDKLYYAGRGDVSASKSGEVTSIPFPNCDDITALTKIEVTLTSNTIATSYRPTRYLPSVYFFGVWISYDDQFTSLMDTIAINNNARGAASDVNLIVSGLTDVALEKYFISNSLLDGSGSLLGAVHTSAFEGQDYISLLSRDYALSFAAPRLKAEGVFYGQERTDLPLFMSMGGLRYVVETWDWNLITGGVDFSALTLPAVTVTVTSETIVTGDNLGHGTSGGSGGSGGSSSSGAGYVAPGTGVPALTEAYIGTTRVQPSPTEDQDLTGIGNATLSGKLNLPQGAYLEVVNVGTTANPVYAIHTNIGLYSDSFVSAFGASNTGGGGGGGIDLSAMWTNLQINESGVTGYGLQIDYHHLPTIAYNDNSGFVTSAAWSKTGSTNYLTLTRRALTASDIPSLTTSKISDLETWINGKDFLTGNETITLSGVVSGSGTTAITTSIADGKITNAMLAGSIANGKLANSAITINGTSTSLGGSFATASITAGTAGTSSATSGLSITIPYVTLNKYGIVTAYGTHTHSISKANITSAIGSTTYAPYNSAGYLPLSGGVMTGPISGVTYLSVNRAAQTTYRLDVNGTSRLAGNTSVTGTLTVGTTSANKETTLNGTLSVLGAATFNGASTFNDNVTVDSTSSITLGNGVLTWDAQNSAWKLTGNLYATGFISAFGSSDTGGGGGGIDLSAMWANLQVNESGTTGYNLQINPGHLTTALGTYVNAITTTGSGNAITSVSKSGSALTFTKGSSFALASRTVTGTGYLTGGGALSANRTIDIASTYKGYIDEGHTAYGWGDHSQVGYLTGITSSMVTTALGFTPANSTALGNYLPLTGGTMSGNITMGTNAIVFNQSTSSSWKNPRNSGLRILNVLGTTVTGAPRTYSVGLSVSGYYGFQIASFGGTADSFYIRSTGNGTTAYDWRTIYHSGNLTQSVVTGLIGSTTYAPYNADGYLPLSGGTLTGTLTVKGQEQYYIRDIGFGSYNGPVARAAIGVTNGSTSLGVFGYYGKLTNGKPADTSYMYIGMRNYDGNNLRIGNNLLKWGNDDVWHAGNDGSGSGLDADLLDGQHGSYYAAAASLGNYLPLSGGTMTGNLTAPKFIKTDGTSSQFLKADGSVDSSVYLTTATAASTYLPLSGGTITGVLVLSNNVSSLAVKDTGGTARSSVFLNSSNGFYVGYGTSAAGYNTYLGGNQIYFQYGTGHATGMTLTSDGNVGIGTTTPYAKLQVNADNNVWTSFNGSSIVFRKLSTYTTGYNNTIRFEQVDSSGTVTVTKPLLGAYSSTIYQFMYLGGSQTDATVRITATGVGIKKGNASPSYALDVTGVIHSTVGIFSDGYVSSYGQSTTSDARLKKDFRDTTLTVDDIAHAPAITFLWKDREGKRQAGSLAQYWETVLPEVVTDIEGKKGLDYGAAALVSAITIARDVNDHEKRIRELERENRELKRRLGYADR